MADEREPSNGEELGEVAETDDGQQPDSEPIDEEQARQIAAEEFESQMSTAEHQRLLLSMQAPPRQLPAWAGAVIGAIVTGILFLGGWLATVGETKAVANGARETNRLQDVELQRLNAVKLDSDDFQKWFQQNSDAHNEIKADQKEQNQELKDASKKLDQILSRLPR